jgi:hypothetical protein
MLLVQDTGCHRRNFDASATAGYNLPTLAHFTPPPSTILPIRATTNLPYVT